MNPFDRILKTVDCNRPILWNQPRPVETVMLGDDACANPTEHNYGSFAKCFYRPIIAFVGSEVAHKVALTLATVRRSNCTCGFPAYSFHEDTNYEIRSRPCRVGRLRQVDPVHQSPRTMMYSGPRISDQAIS